MPIWFPDTSGGTLCSIGGTLQERFQNGLQLLAFWIVPLSGLAGQEVCTMTHIIHVLLRLIYN